MFIYVIPLLLGAAFFIPMLSIKTDKAAPLIAIVAIGTALFIVVLSAPPILGGQIYKWYMASWAPPIGIAIAVDGLSLLMTVIITGLGLAAAVFSYRYITRRKPEYYAILLLVVSGMFGIAITGDLFNLYVFFEIMSVSSYIIVAWSRTREALEGSIKYLIINAFATSLILLGIAFMYGLTGTLNMADIATKIQPSIILTTSMGLMMTGFLVKAALFPLHFWVADAYPAAPSPMSALLSGVMVNLGLYSILRVIFITSPMINVYFILVLLGMISMVVGGFMAIIQKDIKRLLAYSSVSQMGYCFLAIGLGTSLGLSAGLFQVLNNAVMKSLLFFCAGVIVYTVGVRNMNELGGLWKKMPLVAACFVVGALAIAGVPPFSGFASKYMIYLATWEVSPFLTVFAIVISGVTLIYYLKAFSTIFLGPENKNLKIERPVPKSMMTVILALTAAIIVLGFFPELGLALVQPATASLLNLPNYISVVLGG
ncbi:MAG: proton-conducting transporter membrane subunit [Candidatus Aenigmarchaeota archaeon]|nr:proton-conducting transporter membrane subunit [Candidatus Aenigmarchaeota archaeon]